MPTGPGLPLLLSVTLTGVCDGVDLASPSIKRNLNICTRQTYYYTDLNYEFDVGILS